MFSRGGGGQGGGARCVSAGNLGGGAKFVFSRPKFPPSYIPCDRKCLHYSNYYFWN